MSRKRISRFTLAMLAATTAGVAQSTTYSWPGAAPCDASLQGCIASAGDGDVIEVASNAVIDESLSFGVPLTLRAANGYTPRLAADRFIAATAAIDGDYAIEGFTLQRGLVQINHTAGDVGVRIRRVRVLAPVAVGAAEISLYNTTTAPLDYDIGENDLAYEWDTYDGAIHAALQILDTQSGTSSGRIHENRISASGAWAAGILVTSNNRTHTTRIDGNWIRGGNAYGSIDLRQGNISGAGGGSLTAYVVGNIVTPLRQPHDAYGIKAEAYVGGLALQAFNNTVSGAYSGVNVYAASGTVVSGRIANNLLAGNILNLAYSNGGSGGIGNDHNLLYDGSTSGVTLGTGTITADPLLRGAPGNPWLNPGSPAIDAADSAGLSSVLASAGLARVDGAGLRRFKGAGNLADIGAFEYGDTTFLHRTRNPPALNYSVLDDASVNGQAGRRPQLTANWNPDGSTGVYWNHPVGMLYSDISTDWSLRDEDLVAFGDDVRFNLFAPADGSGNLAHAASAANVSGFTTRLSATGLDDEPDRILLITRNSVGAGGSIYDDTHPAGVFYFSLGGPGSWFISHLDSTAMGEGGGYNVYWQEPSANAYRHVASAGNITGNYTLLDHPLLNGHRCARPHVTQSAGRGVFNGHHVGVWYTGARWSVFNQDGTAMPPDAEFDVVVDAQQVFECSDVIFADGFD
jgi:hypothetical protein